MIQQIQSEEEDDDVIDSEAVDESISGTNDGNVQDQTEEDQQRSVLGLAGERCVVSIKPGGVKATDHNQYVDQCQSFLILLLVFLTQTVYLMYKLANVDLFVCIVS